MFRQHHVLSHQPRQQMRRFNGRCRRLIELLSRSAAPAMPNKPMHATCETHARDGRRWAGGQSRRTIRLPLPSMFH